jgi:thioredoxin family protein
VLDEAPGSIAFRFEARDLNLVMGPPEPGAPVRFTVRLDGRPPGEDHVVDVDAPGDRALSEPRMYQLVRLRGGAAERTFEATFPKRACARTCSHSARPTRRHLPPR